MLSAIHVAQAQDIILLRNGDEIQGKVEMISNGMVTYQANGSREQSPTQLLYMIKYENGGCAFFDAQGESTINTGVSTDKLTKKDIAIYLCEGAEIIASDIAVNNDEVTYRAIDKSKPNILTGLISSKNSGSWNSISKDKVFMIRYGNGRRHVINDLLKIEEQARIDAMPKVKHPFVPINKDESLPCPAEIETNDGQKFTVIIYDMEREYVHYRKKEWQDGPIYRMQRSKIKEITLK